MDVPEILYKYTPCDTALLILQSGRLRWSSPSLFNDLAEFQRMPRFEPSLDDTIKEFPRILVEIALGERKIQEGDLSHEVRFVLGMVREFIDSGMDRVEIIQQLAHDSNGADAQMASEIRAMFDSIDLNSARVFCLTDGFANDVMWAHYAEQHTGVVLGFRHLPDLDTPFLAAQPVKYSEEPPVVGSGVDFLLYGDTPELRKKTLDAVCATKSSKWEYENEWRVFGWCPEEVGKNHADYKFYPEELESVCFGPRIDPKGEEEIRMLVRSCYSHCDLYRIEVADGETRRVSAL